MVALDRPFAGPRRNLVRLGGERSEIVADDLDQRAGRVGIGRRAVRLELRPDPARQVSGLRGDVVQHLAGFPHRFRQRVAAQRLTGDERKDGSRNRVGEVGQDGLDVRLSPPFDALDDDQPPTVAPGEQAEGVAGCDRVVAARRVGREQLD